MELRVLHRKTIKAMRIIRKIRWWWYRRKRGNKDTEIIQEEFVSAYWKFKILIKNPITNKYDTGSLVLNINLNPIERWEQKYIKQDSSPIMVTKCILKDGGSFLIKEKPEKLFKTMDWITYDVN